MTTCCKCNGKGTTRHSFDSPLLTCTSCQGRGYHKVIMPIDGMWENPSGLGPSKPKRLGASMDEIFYKHHGGLE